MPPSLSTRRSSFTPVSTMSERLTVLEEKVLTMRLDPFKLCSFTRSWVTELMDTRSWLDSCSRALETSAERAAITLGSLYPMSFLRMTLARSLSTASDRACTIHPFSEG